MDLNQIIQFLIKEWHVIKKVPIIIVTIIVIVAGAGYKFGKLQNNVEIKTLNEMLKLNDENQKLKEEKKDVQIKTLEERLKLRDDKMDYPERLLEHYNKISSFAINAFENVKKELEKEQLDKVKLKKEVKDLEIFVVRSLDKLGFFTKPEIVKALNNRYFKVMLLNGISLVKPFKNGDIYLNKEMLYSNAIILDLSNQDNVSSILDNRIGKFLAGYNNPVHIIYNSVTIQTEKFPKLINNKWGANSFSTIGTAVESLPYETKPYDILYITDVVKKLGIKQEKSSMEYWKEVSN